MMLNQTFIPPDTTAALPWRGFQVSRSGCDEAATLVAAEPGVLFHHLVCDQESEAVLLAARRILDAFLRHAGAAAPVDDAEMLAAEVAAVRAELATTLDALTGSDPEVREEVVRQRAPLGLLAGCWLDTLSQPATQPSVVVNRLFSQHVVLLGEGNPRRGLHRLRRRGWEAMGIDLPEIAAAGFLTAARARPLTALHGAFYLALSRLPGNFLPEVVGTHYAFGALGVDDLIAGTGPVLAEPALRAVLAEYLTLAGEPERARLATAVRLVVALEREHVAMLAELAEWRAGLPLESKVAEIIARHAPMAGRQHGSVRVGGRLLSETFGDPDLDLAAFLAEFRESRHVQAPDSGISRFIRAMKLGGPMFGIFNEREADTFKAWVASVQAGQRPEIRIAPNRVGDERAAVWLAAIAAADPDDVAVAEAAPRDDRELFHRLVNIENFPNTLPLARHRAARTFAEAEILFTHGADGRYTDASWFDYSAEALYERGARVYWDKLVNPYRPLEQIPDRDEVVFTQKTYALGSLIDGAWIHRVANLGHRERDSDDMLFAIYADEMGYGDLRKNHITLIHRVLASMDVRLPHIRDDAFVDQGELPDELYGFSLHQLCMALHPDTFYNEILGYNFAIEMFGAGELRLHEMQKLRHHGFDDCYEQAHLAIDNFSTGHTRQAADIIVTYLDGVRRTVGEAAVDQEWRRIWRGYASFAYFVEHALRKRLTDVEEPADVLI